MDKFTRVVCVETDFDIFAKKSVFPWKVYPGKMDRKIYETSG